MKSYQRNWRHSSLTFSSGVGKDVRIGWRTRTVSALIDTPVFSHVIILFLSNMFRPEFTDVENHHNAHNILSTAFASCCSPRQHLGKMVDLMERLCVLKADLSRLSSSLRIEEGIGGRKYWEAQFSVVVQFCGTAIKAALQWEEEVCLHKPYLFWFDTKIADFSFLLISNRPSLRSAIYNCLLFTFFEG